MITTTASEKWWTNILDFRMSSTKLFLKNVSRSALKKAKISLFKILKKSLLMTLSLWTASAMNLKTFRPSRSSRESVYRTYLRSWRPELHFVCAWNVEKTKLDFNLWARLPDSNSEESWSIPPREIWILSLWELLFIPNNDLMCTDINCHFLLYQFLYWIFIINSIYWI